MKTNISISPVRRRDGVHRIKPGALAQIRYKRTNARSIFSSSLSLSQKLDLSFSLSQSSVAEVTAEQNLTNQVPEPPLLRKIYGPNSLKRKKVAAARSISSTMMMMMDNLNPPIASVIELTGGNNTVLSSDVIAH